MSGYRVSIINSLNRCTNPFFSTQCFRSYDSCMNCTRPISGLQEPNGLIPYPNRSYHTRGFPTNTSNYRMNHTNANTLSHVYIRSPTPISSTHMLAHRPYSSFFVSDKDKPQEPNITGSISMTPSDAIDWIKEVLKSVANAVVYTGDKVKVVKNNLTPYVDKLFDSQTYLETVIVPIGCTLTATILAWAVMPRIFRRIHKYSTQGPAAFLTRGLLGDLVPYDQSSWSALEVPARYLISFLAFLQIATMVAPTTIASTYIGQAGRGAAILSFVWFLQRWKTNVFGRALSAHSISIDDREKLLTVEKLSSVGLFVLGSMALAEACGVAVQSIMTVGGIGGVATAFAARDVLGNVLSGLSLQFSKPFSLGDTIKAGSIEGQVVEMGLTSTSLLNAEKFPVIVPNSLFSSQVIVNKSRAQFRAIVSKIPLQLENLEKIPQISDEIRNMLKSNSNIFLGKEVPYCFLSRIESSYAELTLGCNLKSMSKDEWYTTEQDILLQSARIIKEHGATLGNTLQDILGR